MPYMKNSNSFIPFINLVNYSIIPDTYTIA